LQIEAAIIARTFQYDIQNNLKETTTADHGSIIYEYDSFRRLTKVKDSQGRLFQYDYDANNNCTEMRDENGTTQYGYDLQNRLIAVTYPDLPSIQYSYDSRSRLERVIYPGDIHVSYSYDNADRLTSVTTPQGKTQYIYDHVTNTLSCVVFPNGITTKYGYDHAKRVISVYHKRNDETLIIGFRYILDGNGNRRQTEEISNNGTKITQYSYDKLNRLVSVACGKWYERFTYDALGNRLTKETPFGLIEYEYDENNLLKKAGETSFFYDLRGNLIKKSNPKKTAKYTYDVHDNLVAYQDEKYKVVYSYDGDGRRISKTVNGEKTVYINDVRLPTTQVLIEASEDKKIKTIYFYGLSRLEQFVSGKFFNYLYDYPDRNVIGLADQHQRLCNRYDYAAFGSSRVSVCSVPNQFSYAGEAFEKETGLIFLRNRYYDPEIGRFISADPSLGRLINPQSFNPYAYAGNNPINLIDPLGLRSARACSFPAGTVTKDGKSLVGHGFWILTKDDGEVIVLGRYPTGVRNNDELVAGTIFYEWPATDQQIDAIVAEVKTGGYWGVAGNCIDGLEQGLKILGVEHPSFSILGISMPPKIIIWMESLNGRDDFKQAMKQDLKFAGAPDVFSPALRPAPTVIKPACPCSANSSGDFGGVSLDKTARLIGSFTDIVGATYDSSTGQLILIGDQNYSLPPMEFDDFAVAVRSVYGLGGKLPQDPGVSIDWNSENNRKIEKNKLEHLHPMLVHYEGSTEGTRFGAVMFEADRLLKCLTLGKDNINEHQFKVNVPGYSSLAKRYSDPHLKVIPALFNRIWFVPREITLIKSRDGQSIIFDRVEMEVLTESKRKNKTKENEAAEDFATHLTAHFDQFAQQYPILEELKRLGKITSIVKWVKDNNIPLDLSLFRAYTPKSVATPFTTPAIAVSYLRPGLHVHPLVGGVVYQLSDSNFHEIFDDMPQQLQENVVNSRPSEDTMEWDIGSAFGEGLKAVAHTVERTRKIGSVQKAFIDMKFLTLGEFPLQLVRYYNSFNDRLSGFGKGWEVSPALLLFPRKRVGMQWVEKNIITNFFPEIVVFEEGREFRYILQGLDAQALPIYQTSGLSAALLEQDNGNFVLRKDKKEWFFDSAGRLLQQTDREGRSIKYGYDNGRLMTIFSSNGKKIQLIYENNRINRAVDLEGKVIYYTYDANDQLHSVRDDIGTLSYYTYDSDNNLSAIYDAKNCPMFEAVYDDYHRAVTLTNGKIETKREFSLKDHTARVKSAGSLEILNQYDNDYRLLKSQDSLNRNIEIAYQKGILQPSVIKDSFGREVKYGYDNRGNLISVKNHAEIEWKFWYDNSDRLIASQDGRGRIVVYLYDDKGRLQKIFPQCTLTDEDLKMGQISFQYALNETIEYAFDDRTGAIASVKRGNEFIHNLSYDFEGRLFKVTDPYGYTIRRSYDNRDRLTKVEDGEGGFEYDYDERNRVVKISSPVGHVEYDYDEVGHLSRTQDANGNETVLEYDDHYNLSKVIDGEGGVTWYEYNDFHSLTRITLPNGSIREIIYDSFNRPQQEVIGK